MWVARAGSELSEDGSGAEGRPADKERLDTFRELAEF